MEWELVESLGANGLTLLVVGIMAKYLAPKLTAYVDRIMAQNEALQLRMTEQMREQITEQRDWSDRIVKQFRDEMATERSEHRGEVKEIKEAQAGNMAILDGRLGRIETAIDRRNGITETTILERPR